MRVHELKESIRGCRQIGQSTTDYFGKLKSLWDDYKGILFVPACKCGRCTCELEKIFQQHVEEEKTQNFLMGLDGERFCVLRSNILSQEKLPSLAEVYHMVGQEERHKKLIRGRENKDEVVGFSVQREGGSKFEGKITCSFCKKDGHEVGNCFKRTGKYLEWWFDNSGRRRGKPRGTNGRERGKAVAHVVQIDDINVENNNQGSAPGNVATPGITAEQWKSFLDPINQCKKQTSKYQDPLLNMPIGVGRQQGGSTIFAVWRQRWLMQQ